MHPDTRDHAGTGDQVSSAAVPAGLPEAAAIRRRVLASGESLDLLVVPLEAGADHGAGSDMTGLLRDWVSAGAALAVVVPLYDCLVAWAPGRAAIVGPAEHLGSLDTAIVTFAGQDASLRDAERQGAAILDAIDADVAASTEPENCSRSQQRGLAMRYHDAVGIARRLSLLSLAIHTPPIHPPTLASQLGERLRDRARLIERHAMATERADLAERVSDASRQRALDISVGRQQIGLEWAIVVLLIVQTTMIVVDMLARRGAT